MAWVDEAHERCVLYASRLEDSVLARGRGLLQIWDSFNAADNPLRLIAGMDGKAVSLNLAMSACLHEVILVICAVLDKPKPNRPLQTANKVSFPIIGELMKVDGTKTLRFLGGDEEIKEAAEQRFALRLGDLAREPTESRLTRLIAFRDTFLAHALDEEFSNPPPILEDIHFLMNLASIISGDCQLALFGRRVATREGLITVSDSIGAVWRMLARE